VVNEKEKDEISRLGLSNSVQLTNPKLFHEEGRSARAGRLAKYYQPVRSLSQVGVGGRLDSTGAWKQQLAKVLEALRNNCNN